MKRSYLLILLFLYISPLFAQTSGIDATKIAETYSNSIVKILLFDSLAEKSKPGSGYIGRGSGFIVTEDGIVFTNSHVVDFCMTGYIRYDYYHIDQKETSTHSEGYSDETLKDISVTKINRTGHPAPIIQVYTGKGKNDYKLYYAKVLAIDTFSFDGAILKIVSDINGNPIGEKFHPVLIGNSDSTRQGEDLCIYGFPAQYAGNFEIMLSDLSTLTFGKHSGFDYVFNTAFGYIKTDASINGGNSGGPIFNSSNKVIGIATATGNKTGIGLIGGINAMYLVASVDTSLLNKLRKIGLVKPQIFPQKNTSVLAFKRNILAGDKNIKKYNTEKKIGRQFLRGKFTFKISYPIIFNEVLTMPSVSPMPFLNPITSFYLTPMPSIEIEKQLVLWRIKKNLQISFYWFSMGFTPNIIKPVGQIYHDSINNKPNEPKGGAIFHAKPGLAISILFAKRLLVDVNIKPIFYMMTASGDEWIYYQSSPDTISYTFNVRNYNSLGFMSSVGIDFTFNHFTLGFEYKKGSTTQGYDYMVQNYFNGSPNGSTSIGNLDGSHTTNSLCLSLGYSFYKSTLKKLPRY